MSDTKKKDENLSFFLNICDVSRQDTDGNSPVIEIAGPFEKHEALNLGDKFAAKYQGEHYQTRLIVLDAEYSPNKEAMIKKWGLEYY